MTSNETRHILLTMTKLLREALESGDTDLIPQYTWGVFVAKTSHIKAIEDELKQIRQAA